MHPDRGGGGRPRSFFPQSRILPSTKIIEPRPLVGFQSRTPERQRTRATNRWRKSKNLPSLPTCVLLRFLSGRTQVAEITSRLPFPPRTDQSPKDRPPPRPAAGGGTTSVQVTALDGLVNVNSLFTIAVFVGLSLTTPGQRSLEHSSACDAGDDVAKALLVFEVLSFSFFLFSSLVAQGLKLAINLLNSNDIDEAFRAHIDARVLRLGMLGSALGSVLGCVFLLLSMVNVVQIRLGLLSCGSKATVRSVTVLITLVSTALVFYISTVFYSFTH